MMRYLTIPLCTTHRLRSISQARPTQPSAPRLKQAPASPCRLCPNGVGPAAMPARRAGTRLAWPRHRSPHPPHRLAPGDLRRRPVMRTRTSYSRVSRVVSARIPACGGKCLVRTHSVAPHSPVLRTWEMRCFAHPARDSLFPHRGRRSPRRTGGRRAESNDHARGVAPVTLAACSARPPFPSRRIGGWTPPGGFVPLDAPPA